MPTTPKTYRVSSEVQEAIAALAAVHGGVDRALRAFLIEHPKNCLGDRRAPNGKHLEPCGTPFERSADLDEHLTAERESNGFRVEDAKSILIEKIPKNSPEGRLRDELESRRRTP